MAYNPQNPNGSTSSANSSPVVIANDQAAVPVSGPLTNTELRGTPLTVTANAGTGTMNVSVQNASLTVAGPLTDTQLRATAVPVSLTSLPSLAAGSAVIGSIANATFASTQSGTWNINNVSGTVSLPTGAATAAKQPALGTAGSASADVLTVQGIASMTALKVDGSAVTQPVSLSTSTSGGMLTKAGSWQGGNTNTDIKTGPGQVYGWYFYNPNTTAVYVKLYNQSGVTPASSGYICTLPIPPVSGANAFGLGIVFDTAIYMTMGSTRTGTGQPSQFVDYTIFYK